MGLSESRARLRGVLKSSTCTTVVAVLDPMTARLAYEAGWKIVKLNSSTMKAVNFGLPDDVNGTGNFTDYADVIRRIRRMAPDMTVIVDAEQCGGTPLTVARWVKELEAAGASGIEIEDRYYSDDYGTEPIPRGLYPVDKQVANLKAALAAREDPATVITARTCAFSSPIIGGVVPPIEETLERIRAYREVGADALMIPARPAHIREEIEAVGRVTDIPLCVLRMPPDVIQDEQFLAANHVRIRYISQSTVFDRMVPFVYDIYKKLMEDKGGTNAMMQKDTEYGEFDLSFLRHAESHKLLTTPRFRSPVAAIGLHNILAELEDEALRDRVGTAFWARVDEPTDADAERRMRAVVADLRRQHPAAAESLAKATGVPGS